VSDEIRVAALTVAPPDFTSGRRNSTAGSRTTRSKQPAGDPHAYVSCTGTSARSATSRSPQAPWIQHTRVLARAGGCRGIRFRSLLARLAVANQAQGRGIGRQLVRSAAQLTVRVARLIAVRALVIDALDEQAAAF